jgi:nickel transport protein
MFFVVLPRPGAGRTTVRLRALAVAARRAAAVVAALALLSGPAAAHEILHEVQRGRAVAVRTFESDGDPVAATPWEVYSPTAPGTPWQQGRTDRAGWLAFVPDVPGAWRVRVIEATGHGLDIVVEVAPPGSPAAAPATASAASSTAPASPPAARPPVAPGAAFVLRPLLGLAIIGVVFTALFLAWRKKDGAPRP